MAIEQAKKAMKELKKDRLKLEINGKEVVVREKYDKLVLAFDKYAKVIDVAIQQSPKITSLVWAGIRVILQVRLSSMRLYAVLTLH